MNATPKLAGDKRPLVMVAPIVGKPVEMVFVPQRPYTACRICGAIFQPWLNRLPQDETTAEIVLAAEILRREWSQQHARFSHTSTEHRQLELSGRYFTPEATNVLCTYGLIPLTDIVMDTTDEARIAALEAVRMPVNDVEGS